MERRDKIMANVLIFEDEVYLAQKVSAKLTDEGYVCDIAMSVKDINKNTKYDTILLSTNLHKIDYVNFIKKYKNAIVIVLASYVSDATVSAPIIAGASDYMLKPFMMDELLRKIKHFEEFKKLKAQNKLLKEQNQFLFRKVKAKLNKYQFPLIIQSTNTIDADKLAFDISCKENKELETVILSKDREFEYCDTKYNNKLVYFCGFHTLDKSAKILFTTQMKDKNIIIYQNTTDEFEGFNNIIIKDEKKILSDRDILNINDYVKYIVLNFQNKFPDTQLSQKLGISRKSLWEKRKKLGIEKKK